jgi:hypothetical protein
MFPSGDRVSRETGATGAALASRRLSYRPSLQRQLRPAPPTAHRESNTVHKVAAGGRAPVFWRARGIETANEAQSVPLPVPIISL